MQAAQTTTVVSQFLTFRIGGEQYAVGILKAREILEYQTPTRVPRTPGWIRGVINLRGSVVPVIDLAAKFGSEPCVPTPATCIVILETGPEDETTIMGVIADAVDEVIELGEADILPPPAFGTRARVDFLLGMGRWHDGLALLLDIERALSAEELLSAASAAGRAAQPERRAADRAPSR
jgi:purine-binding chemotaxis protein CheW